MNVVFTAFAAAFGALLLIVAGYLWISRKRLRSERVLRERLGEFGTMSALRAPTDILRRDDDGETTILDRLFAGKSFEAAVTEETRRAGLTWTAGRFAGFVLAGLVFGSLSAIWLPVTLAFPFGIGGALAPFLVVRRARTKRERQIEAQLPEAVDMLVSSMKAGYSLQAGMSFVGSELPAPTGPEFARFYDEQRLGVDVKRALLELQDRLGTLDARMLVLSILIQRETGGNLAEVLDNISRVIRERIAFRDQVGVLTSESKVSAIVLSSMPVLLFFVIQLSNPDYMNELTSSTTGQYLIGYGVFSLIFGFLMLQRMSRIEV